MLNLKSSLTLIALKNFYFNHLL